MERPSGLEVPGGQRERTKIADHNIEDVWNQFHDRLLWFIVGRIDSFGDSEDVLQEVFIRIHRNSKSLRDSDLLVPWIYRIARNATADYWRAQSKNSVLISTHHDDDSAIVLDAEWVTPSGQAPVQSDEIREELANCIEPLIERLPATYREAVTLIKLRHLTQRAVSEKLGISLPGVKSRVQRGRTKLKSLLVDCCHFEFDSRGTIMNYKTRNTQCSLAGCGRTQPD